MWAEPLTISGFRYTYQFIILGGPSINPYLDQNGISGIGNKPSHKTQANCMSRWLEFLLSTTIAVASLLQFISMATGRTP